MTQKVVLEIESYMKLKGQGKSDADIAKQFGIKQPTLIYYKKKWEKEASQAAKKAAEATIEKIKQPEPVKAETKQLEVAPIEKPQQPDTAVVKAPEPKPIGEAINEALNEAFAEKSAEYERLIAALRNDLNTAHQQLDEKDEKIRNLEHLHDACEDCENEISTLQQEKADMEKELLAVEKEKEELERKCEYLQQMKKKACEQYDDLWSKIHPLEEENHILRQLVKKWA
ncbi:MAG: hypothetical protein Q8898_09685 [Bacillota bacterium]|nr:hypothetical protein [Bacillota bacterium]